MKHPHCLTQKCQKLNQLLSSLTLTLEVAPNESHQERKHNDCQHPQGIWHSCLVAKNLVLVLQLRSNQLFGVLIE
jgi:hypothetical protein